MQPRPKTTNLSVVASQEHMPLNSNVIEVFKQVVGPKNVLTDPEDLYIYSFERFFRGQQYPRLDVVIKATSHTQAKEVVEIAEKEGITVVQRGTNNAKTKQSNKKGVILLDNTSPPELIFPKVADKWETAKLDEEIHRAGHGTFRNFALALQSFFQRLPARHCLDCTICSGYCTVASSFNNVETWSSKGRTLLMRGLSTQELQPSPKLIDILYTCSLCGLCFAQCFEDAQVRKAIMHARCSFAESGLTPATFTESAKNISDVGDPSGMSVNRRISWMKAFPKLSFPRTADILYWVGCVVATRTPDVPKAVVNVLHRVGVDFTTIGEREGCCGYVLLASGLWKEAEKNAAEITEKMKQTRAEILVTSCAGCYYTFKKMFPELLGVEMSCEVLHVTQFVERQVKEKQLQLGNSNMKVTYHDPCSLGRHSNVYDPPRNVLKAIPNLELIEMPLSRNRARCCGAGGGLWAFNNQVASESACNRLIDDTIPLRVDTVATACPTCHINLHFASVKKMLDVKIVDIMELVEKAMSEHVSSTLPSLYK